jgi:hypothetical protein
MQGLLGMLLPAASGPDVLACPSARLKSHPHPHTPPQAFGRALAAIMATPVAEEDIMVMGRGATGINMRALANGQLVFPRRGPQSNSSVYRGVTRHKWVGLPVGCGD